MEKQIEIETSPPMYKVGDTLSAILSSDDPAPFDTNYTIGSLCLITKITPFEFDRKQWYYHLVNEKGNGFLVLEKRVLKAFKLKTDKQELF